MSSLSFNSIEELADKIIQLAKDIKTASISVNNLSKKAIERSQKSLIVTIVSKEFLKLKPETILSENDKIKADYLKMFTFNDSFREQEVNRLYQELIKI